MRKKVIITVAIAACLALCAVVWPQTEMLEDTPMPSESPAVYATKVTVEELKMVLSAEEEKTEITQPEQTQEAALEPRYAPAETFAAPEVQPTPDPAPVLKVSNGSVPEQAAEPPVAQATIEPPSGDMIYVEGFGWIENQGPNHVEYAEDMYENGNKIGIIG